MREALIRTLSGIIYILLLIGATLYAEWTFQLLFSLFLLIATYEFCKLYRIRQVIGFSLSVTGLLIGYYINHNTNYTPFYLLCLPFSIHLIIDLFQNSLKVRKDLPMKTAHLTGYVILPFLIITQLPFIAEKYNYNIIIGIFVLIWTNDTFAYICGRLFGKNKLFERISPKKTIEGFIGGFFFSLVAAVILSNYFTFLSRNMWIFTASVTTFMGTIGDLVESKYKRQANVKDSGNIMPGHGGILDRLDSLIFAAPFLFLIYQNL